MTHFGREGEPITDIAKYLNDPISDIVYGTSWDPNIIRAELSNLQGVDIYMLPNVRTHPGEESNDPGFAQLLASLADVYVNDAFSASHRNHASIVGVPKHLPGYSGYQLNKEIENLSKVLAPDHPTVVVIGGAKFDTKMPVIEKYLATGARIYVVGALAHPIYKAMGYNIGISKSDESAQVGNLINNDQIIVPDYVVTVLADGTTREKHISDVQDDESIIDAGTTWIKSITSELLDAKTIIWNGPLGRSGGGYVAGTLEFMKILQQSKAYRVVGGGDTVACIPESYEKTVADFISTGGGAMLEYLIHGTLPGIDALK